MKEVKLLFQGDSITEDERDRRNYHNLGRGYPKYAAEGLIEQCPDVNFEFINFGICGNRTCQLFDRLYRDAIEFQPDIISVLVGINDIWHRYTGEKILTTNEQIETNYRAILERLKNETNAKIVVIAPYLLDAPVNQHLREGLNEILPIVRRLADEYADLYIPLDEIFDEAIKTQPAPNYYSGDAVHPNTNGAKFIGAKYAELVAPIVKSL